jgi:NAD(P)-dependent dehydrogenase (short-subunit alcohol dehydrogenase family)
LKQVAVVTGGTSGIGLEAANALLRAGATVYVLSRRAAQLDGLFHIAADVSDEAQVRRAIKSVYEREGRLDILINNAGFGISGAAEFTENADAKRLLDVNLFGIVNATRAAIPLMRSQGKGRIVNVSSVAAAVPIPFQAWYSVSKAAINAYTMALNNEVGYMGVSACAVMPGDIRTGFTAARKKSAVGDDVYSGHISRSVAKMERDEQNGMNPEIAGRFIAKVARKRRVKPLYSIGFSYRLVVILAHALPVRLVGWLLGLLYSGR